MERLRLRTAVYLIFEQKGRILFLRRYNTGWADGMLTLPSGHIDQGELPLQAVQREAEEEVGVTVEMSDVQFVHVLYEKDAFVDFYFKILKWQGEPRLAEPDKSSELVWLASSGIGDSVVPKVRHALQKVEKSLNYSETEELIT